MASHDERSISARQYAAEKIAQLEAANVTFHAAAVVFVALNRAVNAHAHSPATATAAAARRTAVEKLEAANATLRAAAVAFVALEREVRATQKPASAPPRVAAGWLTAIVVAVLCAVELAFVLAGVVSTSLVYVAIDLVAVVGVVVASLVTVHAPTAAAAAATAAAAAEGSTTHRLLTLPSIDWNKLRPD